MDWALDNFGDHVRAGTSGARSRGLRCPECKARVYHRDGVYNRPHFAHYSGNSSRACDLYSPGVGDLGRSARTGGDWRWASDSAEPVLIWSAESQSSLSLRLRVPIVRAGYESQLTISSGARKTILRPEDLTRQNFVLMQLREPPGTVVSEPVDAIFQLRIEMAMSHFRLAGNFFRATANGGILESPIASLELGEEYFYVSQRSLSEPYPSALELIHSRQQREWSIYRFRLRNNLECQLEDLWQLRTYFGRDVVKPRPKVEVVWPPATRFDPDGTAVLARDISELIVRVSEGTPRIATDGPVASVVSNLGKHLYRISLADTSGSSVIWVDQGTPRRVRFDDRLHTMPRGVVISSSRGNADLVSHAALEIARAEDRFDLSVPFERLWRKISINGRRLNPVPNGLVHSFDFPLTEIRAGGFGYVYAGREQPKPEPASGAWYSKIERLVLTAVGSLAMGRLRRARSKQDLIVWANEHKAMHLLALILTAFSSEV